MECMWNFKKPIFKKLPIHPSTQPTAPPPCPAWKTTLAWVSCAAGSAGISHSTVLVSTATTPTGIPTNLALPAMMVFAQPLMISSKVPASKSSATLRGSRYGSWVVGTLGGLRL